MMRYYLSSDYSSQKSDLPFKTYDAHIAIVGAGPRGTSTLERICASASDLVKPGARLVVHVVDPYPPGPGRVWRTEQSAELLMNTVASQVTLFTDESVSCKGPIRPGPSLYEWAQEHGETDLGPDDYPSRSQYGRYLRWVHGEILRRAPDNFEVKVHAAHAIRLDSRGPNGRQNLALSNGRTLSGLSAVILAQGHLSLRVDPKEQKLAKFAKKHKLSFVPPSNPADVDLSRIAPGETVFFRGLGLNFFDYMALLTTGRGGRFVEAEGSLLYEPSGKEPRMYAGSRRGIPYQARGDNEKGPYGCHIPLVLTEAVVAGFRKRADSGDYPDFLKEIWPLVAKEVELVYYEGVLASIDKSKCLAFRERFLAAEHKSSEEAQLLVDFAIPKEQYWCWDRISLPYGAGSFESPAAWRDWMIAYLREDVRQAALGNVGGPLKAALDIMRDLRNEIRLIVDHGGLSGTSRQNHLDSWYTPLNAYVSIGPPRQRVEQMIALIDAGILDVIGPSPEVRSENGAWLASSPQIAGQTIRATTLVEARLPDINLRNTGDTLLAYLLKTGQCRPHIVDGYETQGVDVSARPYRIINVKGEPNNRCFALGVPTEGVHWVTAAGVRPGVNSVTLMDTDAVARASIQVAMDEAILAPTRKRKASLKLVSELFSIQKRIRNSYTRRISQNFGRNECTLQA